jgi:hypothetical protein
LNNKFEFLNEFKMILKSDEDKVYLSHEASKYLCHRRQKQQCEEKKFIRRRSWEKSDRMCWREKKNSHKRNLREYLWSQNLFLRRFIRSQTVWGSRQVMFSWEKIVSLQYFLCRENTKLKMLRKNKFSKRNSRDLSDEF